MKNFWLLIIVLIMINIVSALPTFEIEKTEWLILEDQGHSFQDEIVINSITDVSDDIYVLFNDKYTHEEVKDWITLDFDDKNEITKRPIDNQLVIPFTINIPLDAVEKRYQLVYTVRDTFGNSENVVMVINPGVESLGNMVNYFLKKTAIDTDIPFCYDLEGEGCEEFNLIITFGNIVFIIIAIIIVTLFVVEVRRGARRS